MCVCVSGFAWCGWGTSQTVDSQREHGHSEDREAAVETVWSSRAGFSFSYLILPFFPLSSFPMLFRFLPVNTTIIKRHLSLHVCMMRRWLLLHYRYISQTNTVSGVYPHPSYVYHITWNLNFCTSAGTNFIHNTSFRIHICVAIKYT